MELSDLLNDARAYLGIPKTKKDSSAIDPDRAVAGFESWLKAKLKKRLSAPIPADLPIITPAVKSDTDPLEHSWQVTLSSDDEIESSLYVDIPIDKLPEIQIGEDIFEPPVTPKKLIAVESLEQPPEPISILDEPLPPPEVESSPEDVLLSARARWLQEKAEIETQQTRERQRLETEHKSQYSDFVKRIGTAWG